tara:strand:+ start:269 stop:484 length:216 start_codon:yes stop_codon:yes gene_type:complete
MSRFCIAAAGLLASWPPGLLGAKTTRAPFALRFDEFNGQPGILFPDGNKWTKVNGGTPDRRPPNDTLKADS